MSIKKRSNSKRPEKSSNSGGVMIRVMLGMMVGIAFFVVFLYFGGPKYLKKFGAKTEEVAERLEGYEKGVKEGARKAKEGVEETKEKTEGILSRTRGKIEGAVERTKEKLKE
jgi:H+/gluconate symporter-like permease